MGNLWKKLEVEKEENENETGKEFVGKVKIKEKS